jgi:predicted SAM-dependent methyltransferase
MKLVLCAGSRHIDGYKHHDVQELPGIDYVCDLLDIGKHIEPYSCERIEFTHALEHFPYNDTVSVLSMVRSLLAPGGELYLEVPNFAWHAKLLMEGKEREAVYYAFGGQLDEWDFHKAGFTPNILRDDLELAGFTDVKIINDSSLIATAKQPI